MSEIYGTTSVYERQLDHIRKLQAPQPDPIQESLSAIRDALAEQIRLGFEAVQRQTEEDRGAVQGQIAVLGAQLEQIKVKQESTNFINTSINNILARRLPEKQQPAGRKKAKR